MLFERFIFGIFSLYLLHPGCMSCPKVPLYQYHYVNLLLSWSDAQQYCREEYTDLATFESMDDLMRLKAKFSYSVAWFGLHDDPAAWRTSMGNESNSWRWSATGQHSRTGFQSWDSNNPDYYLGEETCVMIFSTHGWADELCSYKRVFICHQGDLQKKS
uniref:C-type lectin domain-containing protein n=1 Tax=Oryzias melastigma TaxID=30732 RepID=A0A3B3D008_ORYME